jgi:hypothetical protein
MARVATLKLAPNLVPMLDTGVYNVNRSHDPGDSE